MGKQIDSAQRPAITPASRRPGSSGRPSMHGSESRAPALAA